MSNSIERLAKQVINIDRRLTSLAVTPKLANSSIENGAIDAYDETGQLVMSVGTQFDGTHAAVSVSGPPPPQPSAPSVTPSQLALTVAWDGSFVGEDGLPDETIVVPSDFSRVEVHVSDDPNFDPREATSLMATIETPRGASVVVGPLQSFPYYVRLVARSLSGKSSDPSSINSATPLSAIDKEALTAELSALQDSIDGISAQVGEDLDATLSDLRSDLADANQQIIVAQTMPITDERFDPNSLTVWPFINNIIPQGSLAPGAVSGSDIADFSLVVRKFNTNRHHLY